MDKIEITLETRHPTLEVSLGGTTELGVTMDNAVLVAGIKDVQVDGQSVVDKPTRIANIPLGDGLEFKQGRLNIKGGAVKYVTITPVTTTGTLTAEEIAALLSNPQSRIVYNNIIYYPATKEGTIRTYISAKTDVEYNRVTVNVSTGEYQLATELSPTLVNHINDTVRHITATEREYWNNKVAVDVEPDPEIEGDTYIVKFYK